ncbi:MAG: inositol monophosphatase [Dehalococcoidia bacterium]|nr:inositol monophosphatase [Dehalococcoidia bacterium]
MDDVRPEALLELATAIALEAGGLVARGRLAERALIGTKSTLTDMVTEVDHASEALIVRRILEARPGDGILGEEGTAREGTTGLRWVIDPLDGTTNFLYGFPAYAVSIAVEGPGGAIAGVVRDAARGETFAAALGHGATADGAPIRVNDAPVAAHALIGTGFGYSPERRAGQAAVLAELLPHIRSAALDLCSVACGRLDGYYEQGIQPWDHAAGALIVREAGGRTGWVPRAFARDLDPPLLLAAGPALFEALTALFGGVGAKP